MLTGSPSALRISADALAPQQGFPGADLAVVLDYENRWSCQTDTDR